MSRMYKYAYIFLIAFSGNALASKPLSASDTLVVPVTTITELNPHMGNDVNLNKVLNQITRKLVSLDDSLSPIPDLTQNWSINTKLNQITFVLNKNIFFNDGSDINSHSIFEMLKKSHKEKSDLTSQILDFKNCKSAKTCNSFQIASNSKFRITLNNKNFILFLRKLAGIEASVYKLGAQGEFIGSGPYKIQSLGKKNIVVIANDSSLRLKKIIFKKVSAENGLQEFLRGNIDLISEIDYKIDETKIPQSSKRQEKVAATFGLVFNINPKSVFYKKEARKAIQLAINKNDFIRHYGKQALPAFGLIPKGFIGHQTSPLGSDIEKAKEIVQKNIPNNKREVTLALRHKYKGNKALNDYLPKIFSSVGLKLKIKYDSFNSILSDFRNGKYDLTLKGDGPRYYEPSSIFISYIDGQFQNISGYKSKALNEKYYSYEKEVNSDKKQKLLDEMEKIIKDELPVVALFHPVLATWYQRGIRIDNFKRFSIRFWDYPYRTFSKHNPQ